jgi:hypothetical protein
MSEDEKALVYNLRSLARMEHADLSIGDEAADAITAQASKISKLERELEVAADTLFDLGAHDAWAKARAALAPATRKKEDT